MVIGWDEVAAQLESRLAAAEELVTGETAGDAGAAGMDELPRPATGPTEAQRARLQSIARRFDEVQERLRDERSRVGEQIVGTKRERGARSAYRRAAGGR